jgi:DNA-binding NtrC family response regulator
MKLTDILAVPGQQPVLQIREGRLVVESGPAAGRAATFDGSRLVIGSAPSCHLTLEDPAVSRMHAEVRLEGQTAVLHDLASSNGTFINGVRIRAAELDAEHRVQLGQTTLRFEVGDGSRSVELWPRESFGELVGRSVVMRAVFSLLDRVARSEATVLVLGETGTGKDLVAAALHEASPRAAGPFVVVDCGAIPASLMEGELFGAARGAFTGASTDRPGALEQAHGGTLFLDEVGELPLELQPKLLRFLEHHRVKRLGDTRYREVDVRVVAATNQPLYRAVEQGTFREDLYYRLNVITVELPPLRERLEDIPLLVKRFVRRLLRRLPDQPVDDLVSEPALGALTQHPWPGNVRELFNHVQRMVALADPHLRPGRLTPGTAPAPAAGAVTPGAVTPGAVTPGAVTPSAVGATGTNPGVGTPTPSSGPSNEPGADPLAGTGADLRGRTGADPAATTDTGIDPATGLDLDQPFRRAKEEAVARFEAGYLRRLLDRAEGNISAAARMGAVDRAHLYKLLRKHGLI